MIVGTPVYMSPEQAGGEKEIDGRSDQYALASVLYEMIAGEPPFRGPTPTATLMRRFGGPPQALRPIFDIPVAVEQAIFRALDKDPAARYATVSEFLDALEGKAGTAADATADTPTPAASPPTRGGFFGSLFGRGKP
jgi:serine/threonine-protein kinase